MPVLIKTNWSVTVLFVAQGSAIQTSLHNQPHEFHQRCLQKYSVVTAETFDSNAIFFDAGTWKKKQVRSPTGELAD